MLRIFWRFYISKFAATKRDHICHVSRIYLQAIYIFFSPCQIHIYSFNFAAVSLCINDSRLMSSLTKKIMKRTGKDATNTPHKIRWKANRRQNKFLAFNDRFLPFGPRKIRKLLLFWLKNIRRDRYHSGSQILTYQLSLSGFLLQYLNNNPSLLIRCAKSIFAITITLC